MTAPTLYLPFRGGFDKDGDKHAENVRRTELWAKQALEALALDVDLIKERDQTVENNATLQDDTELKFEVKSGQLWTVELDLIYSGNNVTGDYKLNFATTGAWDTDQAAYEGYLWDATGSLTQLPPTVFGTSALLHSTGLQLGVDAVRTPRQAKLHSRFRAVTDGTVKMQFANISAGAGRLSTTHRGARLRAEKLGSLITCTKPYADLNSSIDTTTYAVLSAQTPVAGQVYFVFVYGITTASAAWQDPALSGTNGWNTTWTRITTKGVFSDRKVAVFWGQAVSGTAGNLTATFPITMSACMAPVIRVQGVESSLPYVSSNVKNASGDSTTPNVTLDQFSFPGNGVLSSVFSWEANAFTAGAGFTLLTDITSADLGRFAVEWRPDPDTSVDYSCLEQFWDVIGIELRGT